jgi:hypothetical protein
MKQGVLILGLLLWIVAPSPLAEAKQPQFRVDTLQVELPGKYNSPHNRTRLSSSIKGRLIEMKRCFVAVVKENPRYDGFLWLAVSFDKQGKVRNKTLTTTVENPVAMRCMEWMVDFWKLPRGAVGKANAQVRIFAK